MSVIVKGMKMPKDCGDCPLQDKTTGWCQFKGDFFKCNNYDRQFNCPLVEAKTASLAVFNEEEIHHNCTVQIWKNSVTGETSIGWYKNDDSE